MKNSPHKTDAILVYNDVDPLQGVQVYQWTSDGDIIRGQNHHFHYHFSWALWGTCVYPTHLVLHFEIS